MKKRWIGYVAGRYVSRDKKNSPSAVFSVLGIATGVLALTVIIAVMNGFQLGYIENILEVSSGHLRIENYIEKDSALEERIRSLQGVTSVIPFRETSVIIRGRSINPRGALLRGVSPDALTDDPGLKSRITDEDGFLESGFFDLSSEENIVLGSELAKHLLVRTGDLVTVLAVAGGGFFPEDEDDSFTYLVTGIFKCDFYEYDLGWAFINIDRAAKLSSPEEKPVMLVKLDDRWQDRRMADNINRIISEHSHNRSLSISSWRDYNRSFFSALRTEKLMMFILVGLIFIVVGLNIFQSQRRIVLERREEIGLLRALGATDIAVRMVFVFDGFIIGFIGATVGMTAGLLISFNIASFFAFLENLVNFFISLINGVAGFFGSGSAGSFAFFSPSVFYIKEIPSRVIPFEAALIFTFGFLSALLAAWFASGKVSRTRPAEVLRYE